MKIKNEMANWGPRSASYWMTLLIAAGIIIIGVRFMLVPRTGAAGFGIPLSSNLDLAFGRIKGIRDIFSGLALLPLLFFRMKKATAYVFTAAIIVPATDCLLVYLNNGPIMSQLIHGITVVYMAITSYILLRDTKKTTA
ncbi:DUF4267 domain-containing protein [Mucilaginibacter gilvus]|uniref:DUF4267 domain-containing protein n=1 Tax=Mucilaginibacter gilvus TaxID=2305909 RepID=A0A3S3VU25_9SPHI|nr:DUF4267 domain-containing protein [Mucilaginibacter gilvus]RWY55918.1 DUF4267 domain-containing protein [Mucilaginibacter gilvus]